MFNIHVPQELRDKGAAALTVLGYSSLVEKCKWNPGDLVVWVSDVIDYFYVLARARYTDPDDEDNEYFMYAVILANGHSLYGRPQFNSRGLTLVLDEYELQNAPVYFVGSKLGILFAGIELETKVVGIHDQKREGNYVYDLGKDEQVLTVLESELIPLVRKVIEL